MLWLSEQGFKVIGVELSKVAVESFFEESGLKVEQHSTQDFRVYNAAGITIYQGDFMHLEPQQIASCSLVYDRASIVAIESFNRAAYKTKMLELIPEATPILMVVLDYEQSQMSGPPFSVPVQEVIELYQPEYAVELLQDGELIKDQPHWRKRGLDSLVESALSLTMK